MEEGNVTELLQAIQSGDSSAKDRLFEQVYAELRELAGNFMRGEDPCHTLQPTALVSETVLRLLQGNALRTLPNRSVFFTVASRAMRQILVDHARRKRALKRGGNYKRTPLDEIVDRCESQLIDLLQLEEVLDRLATLNSRHSDVFHLRIFGEYSFDEIAGILNISAAVAEKDFYCARAFLRSQICKG